ncbi:efflux RND transporter periplasmic adaptor subunit [Caproiciproducens faecalis]|uniref:Efflux RND transporter periplasmic adaptor subunit n=1 Tax=Caproiciproducens faecalis TaxID=2820301 RepID=A0ABS7DLQ6_9FIRM|nr:efflux RND transporter periplasmic adaptor subunit [Caproiciproducens faecalis]MBW7572231.1 efflux RND transporter periplasmic adaptor subunit [Caproiciproducens faecalis]
MKEKVLKIKSKVLDLIRNHKKMCIIIASCTVLSAAVLTTVLLYLHQIKASQNTTSYREYTVAKGDVTVGTSESGTVALDEETVSFPVDVTIDSVLVKVGYSVKAGESLVKLNQNSVTDGTLDSRTKLAEAKLSLEQAVADQESKLKTAKVTYDKSRSNAANAYTQEYLTKAEVQNGIATAKEDLKEKQDELTKYLALQKSYPADYAKLKQLKAWRDDTETTKSSYEDQLEQYEEDHKAALDGLSSLESAKNSAYSAWVLAKAQDDGEDEAETEYDAAKDAYNDYADYIASTVSAKESLESKVSLYTAEYNNYSSAYDDFNETFRSKYGSSSTSDDDSEAASSDEIDSKVTSLQSEVKSAQYALEKAQKSASGSLSEAEQTLQSSLIDGSGAESAYELTVNQLAQAVSTQQETYDSLQRELDDVNSVINGDGTLTSPCDGIIVSVGYTDGSDVKAGEAIVTIAKTSAVSLSVSLSEEDVTDLSIGQDAEITLTSYEGQTFPATVESIAASPSRSGSASVTYAVTAKMTDSNTKKVFVGMSGEVEFIKKQKKDVLYVSDQAITFENGVSSVLVKNADGTTTKTTVTTGFSNGQYVEIVSGLKEGETVLVESAVTK